MNGNSKYGNHIIKEVFFNIIHTYLIDRHDGKRLMTYDISNYATSVEI